MSAPDPKGDRSSWPVWKGKRGEEPSDVAYWRSRPPHERLEALEQIRAEYHGWDPEAPPRLQRVVRIIRRQDEA